MTCRECGCYFSYEFDDIELQVFRDLYNNNREKKVLTCPQCSESIPV